jgi:CDP-diacylglycerol pyrophosphatase
MSARLLALGAALAFLFAAGAARADRMALWNIVHGQCVPAAENGAALPPPCLEVDAHDATAVIKDRNGVAQLLAIPTARVTGIEDPAILKPDAPNYFAAAWAQRDLMRRYLPAAPTREDHIIAINSAHSRSQDQLHLHVDCIAAGAAAALAAYAPHLDNHWRPMTQALAGRKYWARRVDSADLAGVNPFRLLADEMPDRGDMGYWSLAAVPVVFDGKPGFALLADHAELFGGGHAEDIADHACAAVK